MLRFDGDRRGGVVVLNDHHFGHGEAGEDEHVADHDHGRRHRRPAEAVVERADHTRGDRRSDDADVDELLCGSALGQRP